MTRTLTLALALALVAAAMLTGCTTDDAAQQGSHADPAADVARTSLTRVGNLAPDFTVTTLASDTLRLADQRGKVVLVNFWATWCPPCKAELPYLEKDVWQQFRDQDFVMVGIAREESADIIAPFQKAQELIYPLAPDPDRSVFARYASSYIPRNYVVGRDGTILYQSQGFEAEEFAQMVALIEKELARPTAWPEAMIRLLPENPQAIVAVENLARLDTELAKLVAMADSLADRSTAPTDFQIGTLLAGTIPEAAASIDPDRPLAVAAVLEPLGTEPPVGFAFVLPLRPGVDEREFRARLIEYPVVEVANDYFVVATTVRLAPAGVLPALVWDLPVDDLVLRMDLADIIASFRPFILMGLSSLVRSEVAQTPPGDDDAHDRMRSVEEAAMRELVEDVLENLRWLELQCSLRDGILSLAERLTFQSDSALDPGPQPSFATALHLSRPQPADSSVVVISALDPAELLDSFPALTELFLLRETAAMAPDMTPDMAAAQRDLLEQKIAAVRLWGAPQAQTTRITAAGLRYTVLLQSADPAADPADHLTGLIASYSAPDQIGPGWSVVEKESRRVAGHQARRFELDFDWEDLLRPEVEDAPPNSQARAVAEDAERLMRQLAPPFWAISTDRLVVLVGDRDSGALEQIMHRLATGEGELPLAITTAVAWAEPGTQLLMVGDLGRMMTGLQALAAETFGDEPTSLDLAWLRAADLPLAAIHTISTIPTILTAGLHNHAFEGKLRLDAASLIALLAALEQY